MSLYREFVLHSSTHWKTLAAFVRANAKAACESGKPLRVIVTSSERKRNAEQNARLWKAVYEQIAAQAWVNQQRLLGLVRAAVRAPEPAARRALRDSEKEGGGVTCPHCTHFRRHGLSAGYCGGRDDLPPAYSAHHPLRQLPADKGASCKEFNPK